MQVSVETTQGLERRVTISIDAAQIEQQVEQALKQESRRARIDGFRPGKVPVSVIKKRYGAAVRQDVTGQAMQRSFYEAIIQEKLNPAGSPALQPGDVKDGEFSFTATFEIFPEVEVTGLDAIEVEKKVAEVNDKDVDAMIDTLRKQQAAWKETKGMIKDEFRVNLDFVGKIDGEEFEGGKAEGFDLAMGAGRMIPGFEDGILGKKTGEEFTIEVNFPEDYHAENLKGKAAAFDIKINKVEKPELAEVNEEFVKLFGIESGELDALKAEIRKNMERELEQTLKASTKEQVLSGLLDSNPIDVPAALVSQEVVELRKQAMQRFGENAQNAPELPDELFTEQAQRRVRTGLLLGELIKVNELKADDEKVKTHIASFASAYEDPTEVLEYYAKNEELMNNVRNVVLEEQAIEFVLNQAKVTEKEVAFDEIMNKQGAN
ncbi:trigger factor [Agarivorans sp. MS3-6]|uniref:trigger factor n=1 Tax=Agarivorans sp. TSD2052 TaxID=2937286 RepID=UPI00200E8658|nr:trigger factor [Agarivorans sp. TSD2052]UPW17099.1 trigger factor [Agarivorans sp. TSD2052]